jgi:deazaflavin-dependent oxidoreductase (nitroreductase family)
MAAVGDRLVIALLGSPLHRLLSGSTDVIRYTGRRTGRAIETPTQYVRDGEDVVILVGHPDRKTWWRNFRTEQDVELLLARRWVPMRAVAVVGTEQPNTAARLLDVYVRRYPKVAKSFEGDTGASRAMEAVVVWCRPR